MSTGTEQSIPVFDLSSEIDELWDDLTREMQRVLRSGQFILGPEVDAFESEVAESLGAKHAIGCNSGTDALVIALRALDIGPGDEVITTPFTFVATPESISQVGATVVFADVDEQTFNIRPDAIEAAITPRTKAIMPVHLFGQPADMNSVMALAQKHGLKVVEDTAQAFGAKHELGMAGTIGDVGCYSFFPTKNLGGYGDGGLITTEDDALADTIRMLRVHGSKKRYHNELHGYNSRLDALQAAILRVKLPHLQRYNDARREAARRYDALLAGVDGVIVPVQEASDHVFHQYTLRITGGRRDTVLSHLGKCGVGAMVYYPVPCHRLPVYADHADDILPVTEKLADEVLSLPMWPHITADTQERVVSALLDGMAGAGR